MSMTTDELVSVEVARELSRKGFVGHKSYFYTKENVLIGNVSALSGYIKSEGLIEAPTQTTAAKWIRERCNKHICIYNNASGYGYSISKADNGTHLLNDLSAGPNEGGMWDTYESALNAALIEALKLTKRIKS